MYQLVSMAMINVLGDSHTGILRRLISGDQSGISRQDGFLPDSSCLLGWIGESAGETPQDLGPYRSRTTALILRTYEQLRSEIEQYKKQFGPHRIGVVIGSSTSGIAEGEDFIAAEEGKSGPFSFRQQELGSVSQALAMHAGVSGPRYTISTACSSSAKVFNSARALLESGLCDLVITGGVDTLSRLTVGGFHALELLSADITNPLSINRSGITLGEGACLFLMKRGKGGISLLGVGESSDAYHISTPDPSGQGASACMAGALKDAGLSPNQINYINLHGTGTIHNDAMESRAVSALFGDTIACSSTKPLTGHLLGASGATELGFCWLLLSETNTMNLLPPHCFDGQYDPQIAPLRVVDRGEEFARGDVVRLLSNSFAFGGSNCSLIIGKSYE